MARAVVGLL